MTERDWVRPGAPVEAAGAAEGAWAGRPAARFELRPLSLGEVLDRTFALYRSRFALFAGIAMIAASLNTVAQGVNLVLTQRVQASQHGGAQTSMAAILMNLRHAGPAAAGVYAVLLVYFLVSAVTHAATAFALFQVYLGRAITAGEALRRVLPRWYRWMGVALWQLGSVLWLPLVTLIAAGVLVGLSVRSGNVSLRVIAVVLFLLSILAALPAGVVLYLRNALAIPAAVTEDLEVRPAMRRSKFLAAGSKGRIFMVLFLAACLLEVVGILQMPLTLLIMVSPGKAHILVRGILLLVTFLGQTVIAPVALIGLTLVYIDQRVRREAFDLELLLGETRTAEGGLPPASGGPSLPSPEGYAQLG